MIRRPPRSTLSSSSAASDVYKRQIPNDRTGTEITLNVLEQGSVSAAIASAMALVRFGVRNYTHPRLYGVFSFSAYLLLSIVLLYLVYRGHGLTVLTNSQANGFTTQIYSFLGGTFNWADEQFATTFSDIGQLSDFWAFMRGPFHDFLLGPGLNQQVDSGTGERTGELINGPAMTSVPLTPVSDHGGINGIYPWIVSYCNMRQVIRQEEDISVESLLHSLTAVKAYTGPFVEDQAQVTEQGQEHGFAGEHSYNFSSQAVSSSFRNAFGQTVSSWDVIGTTGIRYLGAGGVVLTDTAYPECYMWNDTIRSLDWTQGTHGCMYRGSWIAEWAGYNGSQFQRIYEREIQTLSNNRGMRSDTVLVQLGCNVMNTLEEIQAFAFYSVEFMPSGQVVPMRPSVIAAPYPFRTLPRVFYPLVLGLYILCEELQDMVMAGCRRYFLQESKLNVFDWLASAALFWLWVFDNLYQGVIPELNIFGDLRTDTFWTLAFVQSTWQSILGVSCFCMVIKGLKFTKNVPVMCNIANTFSHAVVPVGLLLVVVFLLLFGFAIVFQIRFSGSNMATFNSLGTSMFSVFLGLLGAIDADAIFAESPVFGALLFCLYVTVVLFVALTILIALICESFAAVMGQSPKHGVVVGLLAWYRALNNGDEAEEVEEGALSEDEGEQFGDGVELKGIELNGEPNPVYENTARDGGSGSSTHCSWERQVQTDLRQVRAELRELTAGQRIVREKGQRELEVVRGEVQDLAEGQRQLAGHQERIEQQLSQILLEMKSANRATDPHAHAHPHPEYPNPVAEAEGWTPAQDRQLLRVLEEFPAEMAGHDRWAAIAEAVPGKDMKACAGRFRTLRKRWRKEGPASPRGTKDHQATATPDVMVDI
eukprot:TRINITY_DN8998_c0_g1_i1.p1 TRINITY_DN8998_c0_g1~~TRINITY_DN8998_c0_g1_i1.p1  ORF type:complete len:874 (-),score=164.66 TRINITY_DN8998_c0_g1_i1:148-2769(-)